MKSKYSKEMLENAVRECLSFTAVLRKLNLNCTGSNFSFIKRLIINYDINTDHFTGQSHNKDKIAHNAYTKESFVEKWLILNDGSKVISGSKLKMFLIKFNMIKDKCVKCGLEDEWCGEKITLQLDHINGDHFDNRFENLQVLCPNCHSQTHTFGTKRFKKEIKCIDCGKKLSQKRKNDKCLKCFLKMLPKDRVKKFEISKEELEKFVLIDKMAFDSIGEIFGVSGNAIRRRCKKFGINFKRR